MQKTITHLREISAPPKPAWTPCPNRSRSSKRPRRPSTTPSAPPNWPPARRSLPKRKASPARTLRRFSGRLPAPG
jgi:hypothetical protein